MSTARRAVNESWDRGLAPPPSRTVSEWADERRVLSKSVASEPGPWVTDRTPYLRQIMDTLSPFSAARVIGFMKGSQIGASESILNLVGYVKDEIPTSMMAVLPTRGTAEEWSQQRLGQLVEYTPGFGSEVKGGVFAKRTKSGFRLKIGWSSSAKKLASTPAEFVLCDEVDRFEGDVDGEGDPITVLKRRFTNFPRGKMFMASTPTVATDGGKRAAKSRIEREFLAGDQRYYFVPCPHCGHFQRLVFEGIEFREGPARYRCQKCEVLIEERFKTTILARGAWVATAGREDLRDHGFDSVAEVEHIFGVMAEAKEVSFHLSALYSPLGWYSWTQLAADWRKAQGDVKALKVFVMTVLGETWQDPGEAPDWKRLAERAEEYEIGTAPAGVHFITVAVDKQIDRLVYEVKGWGPNLENWSIEYGSIQPMRTDSEGKMIPYRTSEPEPWAELEANILNREWQHASGGSLPVMVMGVDSGDDSTMVYGFCRRQRQPMVHAGAARITVVRTVVAIKGGHSATKVIENISPTDAARKRGLYVFTVGTHAVKDELYANLELPKPEPGKSHPPGYCHHPRYRDAYFQEVTAEKRVRRKDGTIEYRRDGAQRNEALDLHVYNRFLASLCGIENFKEPQWSELKRRLAESAKAALLPVADPVQTAATAQQAATTLVRETSRRIARPKWMNY